jgi:hypothetical protein
MSPRGRFRAARGFGVGTRGAVVACEARLIGRGCGQLTSPHAFVELSWTPLLGDGRNRPFPLMRSREGRDGGCRGRDLSNLGQSPLEAERSLGLSVRHAAGHGGDVRHPRRHQGCPRRPLALFLDRAHRPGAAGSAAARGPRGHEQDHHPGASTRWHLPSHRTWHLLSGRGRDYRARSCISALPPDARTRRARRTLVGQSRLLSEKTG